jgi:hypothetical protein
VGWDYVSREIEARRRAIAEKLESERRAAQELETAKQVQARLFPQTRVRIILEFGNPNRILAKEFFDHVEREIAALDVNQLRRRSSPID